MQIEHECPQCGAPVVLEETDRLLQCSFCKTRLYISSSGPLRYCLPPHRPYEEEIVFIPYWRFRGMRFSCRRDGIQDGIIDKTVLAIQDRLLPASLGVRPQAMKLRFAGEKENTRFLEPQFSFDESSIKADETIALGFDIMRDNRQRSTFRSISFMGMELGTELGIEVETPEPVARDTRLYHEAFIAETISTVYTPVFVRDNRVYDGITGEPIPGEVGEGRLAGPPATGNWFPRFLPTLCPNCGWDLVAERDSCVLLCTRCNSAWQASAGSLEQIKYGVISSDGKAQKTTCLPFWKIGIEVEGMGLQSYADLVRLANLPKMIRTEWEQPGIHFWVPAFKIAPAVFLRLARQLSLADPSGEIGEDLSGADLWSVNVALSEAAESLRVILAQIAINKTAIMPKLKDLNISVKDSLLVFHPFIDSGYELTQPAIPCAVPKNTLHWGKNI